MNSYFKYSTYFDNKMRSQVNANPPQYMDASFYSQWGTCPYATNPTQATIVNTYFNPSLPFVFDLTVSKKKYSEALHHKVKCPELKLYHQ